MAGLVVWLTGRPAAGKSTIARLVVTALRDDGEDVLLLDGDEIRRTLSRDLGFSSGDRDENVRRVAELAALHCAGGSIAVVAMISPLRRQREHAARIIGEGFVEVHVCAELGECIRRDPKGLYTHALAGEIEDFTGVSSPYEDPQHAALVLDTEAETPDRSAKRVARTIAAWPGRRG